MRPPALSSFLFFPPPIMQSPTSVPTASDASLQAASPDAPYAAAWRSYALLRRTFGWVFFGGIATYFAIFGWVIWFEIIEAFPAARMAGLFFQLGPWVWAGTLVWLGARLAMWRCPRCKETFGLTGSGCAKCGLPRWAVNDEGARLDGRRGAPRVERPVHQA
jgi:hypothetical protein